MKNFDAYVGLDVHKDTIGSELPSAPQKGSPIR